MNLLCRHTYTAANGTTRTWESSQRLTRPPGVDIDGVGIAAIMQSKASGPPSILLQKQFRPPIDAVTIEVPAGLMDEGETAEECALRELKEETGYYNCLSPSKRINADRVYSYTGKIMEDGFGVTPIMFNGKPMYLCLLL